MLPNRREAQGPGVPLLICVPRSGSLPRGYFFAGDSRGRLAFMPQQTFSTGFVAGRENVTLRQLQWWDERNIIRVGRESGSRVYTFADVRRVRIIRDLRKKGITLRPIRHVLRQVDKALNLDHIEDTTYLVTDGAAVRLTVSPLEALNEAIQFRQPCVILKITPDSAEKRK